MSDKEKLILSKAKNGDIEAFEILIEEHQKKVFNIALKMLGNYHDANEIAQEAFIKAFKSIKGFKGNSSFSTWVYRIAVNVCLDELRKRKKNKLIYIDDEIKNEDGEIKREFPDDTYAPETVAETNEIRRKVNSAISALPEEHRIVIILRDINGMSYGEISKITNSPEGTVKSRINRARNALKELLKKDKELFDDFNVKD